MTKDNCEITYKQIKGYEGLYMATNNGYIWSIDRSIFLKPVIDDNDYLHVILYKNKIPKNYKIHRLICLTFLENLDNKVCVDHINRNRSDNRIENLRWATNSENSINSKMQKNNLLNEKGVRKHQNGFQAYITKNNKIF